MHKIVPLLQNVPLFQELSPEELESIAPLLIERKYKKGSILFFEGDVGDELFLIQTGVVKVYRIDNAKEIILALFRDGDYFGDMALIQKGLPRSATAETMEACTIYSLARSQFTTFMERSPQLCLKLLEDTMQRLRRANEQIYDLTFLDVRSRTMKTIQRLAEEHGVKRSAGMLIDVKLTHQQLANLVGTVRESVTKVLQELQEDKIITIDKKMIMIRDMDGLKQRVQL